MALFTVGIHEGLGITDKTKVNEHGTLELNISATTGSDSVLDALEGNDTMSSLEQSFRFYPPNMLDFDKNKKTGAAILKDLLLIRFQFLQFGYIYVPKEKAQSYFGGTKMFEGIVPMDKESLGKAITQLVNEDFMKKVVANLSAKFVHFLETEKIYESPIKFRIKLLRQSKLKNFATIPSSEFDTWIEPMDIPAEASKIAFTDYEISKGKDSGAPVKSDDPKAKAKDVNKAKSLFEKPQGDQTAAPVATSVAQPDAPVQAVPAATSVAPVEQVAPANPAGAQPQAGSLFAAKG